MNAKNPIKLLIVDDHRVVLDGLRNIFQSESGIEVTGEAGTAVEALTIIENNEVDVALIDINLPETDGVELCRQILSFPNPPKVVAFTTYNETSFITHMMKSGASGYLLKSIDTDELVSAIRAVNNGEQYLCAEVKEKLISSSFGVQSKTFIPKLTRREKDVLKLIIDEYTTKEIAEKLYISPATVESHRLHLLTKTGARNTAGLVKIAILKGLV